MCRSGDAHDYYEIQFDAHEDPARGGVRFFMRPYAYRLVDDQMGPDPSFEFGAAE